MITIQLVLVIVAVVLLLLAGFNVQSGRVNLIALGLAAWVLSTIVRV